MQKKIRILLVDKHKLLYSSIEQAIAQTNDLILVGMVSAEKRALDACRRYEPDVLLLSRNALDRPFANTIHCWQRHCARIKTLVLLADSNETCIRALLDDGAAGCFLKEEPPARLVEAIRTVVTGKLWLSRPLVAKLAGGQASVPVDPLTERDLALLRLIAQEKTDKEIAQALHLSERTVRRSLQCTCYKLGVSGRVGVAYEAGQRRLLDESS